MAALPTTGGRIAVVTGGNKTLGFALVLGLYERLGPDDYLYVSSRTTAKCQQAVAQIQARAGRGGGGLALRPTLVALAMDIADEASVASFARTLLQRHGGVDIFVSNASAKLAPDVAAADQVDNFMGVNNRGTALLLHHLLRILRPCGRFIVLSSEQGRLINVPEHHRPALDPAVATFPGVDQAVADYARRVHDGETEAFGQELNVVSRAGQIALVGAAARQVSQERPEDGILVVAVCPGLVRPIRDPPATAPSPEDAARDILWLVADGAGVEEGEVSGETASRLECHGKLVQHCKVVEE